MPSAYHSRCPRGDVQVLLGDVRGGVDELVARLLVLAARVVLEFAPDDAALRVEDRQAGAQLVGGEAEQIQLDAELAMVAPLRLLDQFEMTVECFLRLPGGAVDALQAGVGLVAPPVGRRATGQLERRDVPGGGNVRTAAQVAPPNAFSGPGGIQVVVGGEFGAADFHDVRVAGLVVDQLELVGLVGEILARLVLGRVHPAVEQLSVLDDLLHALLQRREIFRGEGAWHLEVVVEAVGDGRTDAQLRLGGTCPGPPGRGRVPPSGG